MIQRGMWQLILMAQEGDRQAIDELFYASFRCAYLVSYTMTADKQASLDILRESYIYMFQNLDETKRNKSFLEQLNEYSVQRTKALFPSKGFLKFGNNYDAAANKFHLKDTDIHDFDTLPSLHMSEVADSVLNMLCKLPMEQQLCADLFYFCECTPQGIAEILGTTEKRVCGALSEMRAAALPQIEAEIRKTPALQLVNAESSIPWALRNTEAHTLSADELDAFHQSVLENLVDQSVLDTSINEDEIAASDEMQLLDMKPIHDYSTLKRIFNLRTLMIFLLVLLLAGVGIGLHQLKNYNRKHREQGQIISRTTLPISTTAFASERYIFSTELALPTETETEASTEPQTTEPPATTEKTTAPTTKPNADYTFTESGGGIVITGYTGSGAHPEIPAKINGKNVTGIGEKAFANSDITSIKLPSSVKTIGKSAFHGCAGLQSITLPSNVTLIDSDAFRSCTNLKSVSLPDALQKIGSNAFYHCTSLSNISLPDKVTYLGDAAFSGCTTLGSITIPNSVTYLGSSLFYECKSLSKCAVGTSCHVKALGESMFYECTSLTGFTVPSSVKTIPAGCFYCCRSMTSVALPSGLTSIGANAFTDCISLSGIKFSTSLMHIEKNAFSGCTSLRSVSIPSGTLSIGESAFRNCFNLQSISIPATVTQIGNSAFLGCDDLVITCPGNSAAEKYATANHIQIYGKSNELTYSNDSSNE